MTKRTIFLVKHPRNIHHPRFFDWALVVVNGWTAWEPWTPRWDATQVTDNYSRVDDVQVVEFGTEKRLMGLVNGGSMVVDGLQ